MAKGRLDGAGADAIAARVVPVASLDDLAGAGLVIEAVVERLDVKRRLFAELEAVAAADAVLATNTSSLSVTAIAAELRRPERVVGMHFFNPAPVMPLVEVVSGEATAPACGRRGVRSRPRLGQDAGSLHLDARASSSTGWPGPTTARRSDCSPRGPPTRPPSTPSPPGLVGSAWGRSP